MEWGGVGEGRGWDGVGEGKGERRGEEEGELVERMGWSGVGSDSPSAPPWP